MKRWKRLPLFAQIEPDVYVIDTSAWLNIEGRSDEAEVWLLINLLIAQGRIVAPRAVLSELRENPIYSQYLREHERALLAGDRSDDPVYLLKVGEIALAHPGMCKIRGTKTPADPFVVALAELEGYVVVADETIRQKPNRKIPGVCASRKIKCLTLDGFLAAERTAACGSTCIP